MFCEKCGNLMIPKKEGHKEILVCPVCGFTKEKESILIKEKIINKSHEINVVQKDEEKIYPQIKITCPKCGNSKAYFWTIQTRASDEPETKFYKCTKCGYTWRDYS